MFDALLMPAQHRLLAGPAGWLVARGVPADAVTIAGFGVGLAAVPLLAWGHFGAALWCIAGNRLLDGLDGAVARQAGPTDRGAFLDITLDFFFYAAVPFGFALADPAGDALAAAGLILSFVGTGSSFLAFAAIAAKRGLVASEFPRKGFYYLGGLTEGTETIAAFAVFCLWPRCFPVVATTFAFLCTLTTATRWWWGWTAFAPRGCTIDTPAGPDDRVQPQSKSSVTSRTVP